MENTKKSEKLREHIKISFLKLSNEHSQDFWLEELGI
jgi:hypothetical protein